MVASTKAFKIFCIAGTRPEFIKMAPVYHALKAKAGEGVVVKWVSSSQHFELVKGLLDFFAIEPDLSLDLEDIASAVSSSKDQGSLSNDGDRLSVLATKLLAKASNLFAQERPDLVLVQGDTLTTKQVAEAAFYHKIALGHVEAGLRTSDINSPFPEEASRRMVSQIASLHFAPTLQAYKRLLREKDLSEKQAADNNIYMLGNTVVDSLLDTAKKVNANYDWGDRSFATAIDGTRLDIVDLLNKAKAKSKKIILVTAHRRENFASIHAELIKALEKLLDSPIADELELVVSLHRNPEARRVFEPLINKVQAEDKGNVHFMEAFNYPLFVKLMSDSHLILSDSGGIQEEAPYLQKPVLIIRKETERPEAVDHGVNKLAGTSAAEIYANLCELISDSEAYQSMIDPNFAAYGDGKAAEKIADEALAFLQ